MLGLKRLEQDVFWLELLPTADDPALNEPLISAFFGRMKRYGLAERCGLLLV